jgi:sortase B
MNQTKKIISAVLAGIAVVCFILIAFFGIRQWLDDKRCQDALEELRQAAENLKDTPSYPESTTIPAAPTQMPPDTSLPSPSAVPEPTPVPTATPEPTPVPLTNPYRDSFLANGDMAAWIQVPGTVIDYPVMWTPDDEEYYLYRDFNKKDNSNGSLILDADSCVDPLTTNLIIHGHNMKSGAMFGHLKDYENKDFFEEHKDIVLYTDGLQRNYQVIAVFRSQVFKKSDKVFKYYNFFQANTQEEFDDFYQNIKALSLYDTGVSAEFGDHFLTLSTCTYHVEQGRFVVVAKEVESGDIYLPIAENDEPKSN